MKSYSLNGELVKLFVTLNLFSYLSLYMQSMKTRILFYVSLLLPFSLFSGN